MAFMLERCGLAAVLFIALRHIIHTIPSILIIYGIPIIISIYTSPIIFSVPLISPVLKYKAL